MNNVGKACRIKRLLALSVACFLLLSCISPAGYALELKTNDRLREAEHALTSDWFYFLQMEEYTSRDMLWVLDNAKEAVKTSDWDQLQRCLAVLETAALYIRQREMPAEQTTDAQYELLKREYGEDVYVVRIELQGCKQDSLAELELLRNDLTLRYFMKSTHAHQLMELTITENLYKAFLKYDAFATAYLIKLIEPSEYSQKLRSFVREYLPLIESYMPYDAFSVTELESLAGDLLDACEEKINDARTHQDLRRNDLILLMDSSKKGSYDRFSRDSAPIKGLNTVLPAPPWYYSDELDILWELPDGRNLRIPMELENLTENPRYLLIACGDTEVAELNAYLGQLEALGYPVSYEVNDGLSIYSVEDANWRMTVEWDGKDLTQRFWGEIPCLIPSWYVVS